MEYLRDVSWAIFVSKNIASSDISTSSSSHLQHKKFWGLINLRASNITITFCSPTVVALHLTFWTISYLSYQNNFLTFTRRLSTTVKVTRHFTVTITLTINIATLFFSRDNKIIFNNQTDRSQCTVERQTGYNFYERLLTYRWTAV